MSERLTIGSLFTGYGGLDIAAEKVFDSQILWVAENAPAPNKILASHWPEIPNLGDVTSVDWDAVPKVDVIIGGSPCQDLSVAGRRNGMQTGTRSGAWDFMRKAIQHVQPTFVVWENVPGARSGSATSRVEPCEGCVGNPPRHDVLSALGRVLGDLASCGFDAEWTSLRASDVGCCHQRERVFLLAWKRATAHTDIPPALWEFCRVWFKSFRSRHITNAAAANSSS